MDIGKIGIREKKTGMIRTEKLSLPRKRLIFTELRAVLLTALLVRSVRSAAGDIRPEG